MILLCRSMHDLEERLAAVMGSVSLLVTPCTLAQLEFLGRIDHICHGQPISLTAFSLTGNCVFKPGRVVQQRLSSSLSNPCMLLIQCLVTWEAA